MGRADYPKPIIDLIGELKRLPGVGPRGAERIAVWMTQHKKRNPLELAEVLEAADREVESCKVCGFFAVADGCKVCDGVGRDENLLCVVEHPTDVLPLERSGSFEGFYHCLGGKLSPLDNVTPDDLRLAQLVKRVDSMESGEVILALTSDVEGEATANYISEMLEGRGVTVTRLAQGLPAGGGLEHADELTLMRAMQGRR